MTSNDTKKYIVGGVVFPCPPIMVGAGVCKTIEKTQEWLAEAPVVSGTYPRSSNQTSPQEQFASLAREINHIEGTMPLIVSVGGNTLQHYIDGITAFAAVPRVDAIELNLSRTGTGTERIFSFDLATLRTLLSSVVVPESKPLWIKVAPYSDPMLLREVAELINEYQHIVRAVTSCNMFPSALNASGTLADLGGPALRAIALGQVVQFRQYLHEAVDVIGSGGISTDDDVHTFLKHGAKAVQLTTLPIELEDPKSFWPTVFPQGDHTLGM